MAELALSNLKANPERLKKLISKINDKSPFTKVKGDITNASDNVYLRFLHPLIEDVLLENKGHSHTEITGRGKNQIFIETDANGNDKSPLKTFALSGLEKTAELGSSKGSGGGAEATAQTESMCCYFAAYLFNGPIDKFDLSEDYEKALKLFFKGKGKECVHAYHKSRYTLDNLWLKAPMDDEWKDTYMATANKIKEKATKFKGYVYFHRGSPFMDSIYEKKKKCEKHNRDLMKSGTSIGEINEAVISFSNDKWNPGDIWMSTVKPTADPFSWKPKFMKKNMEDHVCDWPSLQTAVYESAMSGETLGISLKKTGKNATWKEFNKNLAQKNEITYKGFRFGDGDFFNSVDAYIEFNGGGNVQYRPTASDSSWQGEVKGTKASGGKAGGGPTNYYCELYFGHSIDSNRKLESGTWKEKKGAIKDADKKKMYELYLIHNKNQTVNKKTSVKIDKTKASKSNPYESLQDFVMTEQGNNYIYVSTKDTVSERDFMTLGDNYTYRGKNASKNFWFGKYMALALVDTIEASSSSPDNRNGFATEVIRYAMSNIDNVSSYFWKIM